MMPSVSKLYLALVGLSVASSTAFGVQPRISEIYFNPPGNPDVTSTGLEYIELYAGINQSLDNYYLIALENENDEFNSQNPGQIENIFDLTGMSTGSNGYMVLAMKNSPYPQLSSVAFSVAVPVIPAQPTPAESLKVLASGAHAYVNRDSGNGFGSGITSSIGHTGQSAELEGSGASYLLIHVDTMAGGVAPVLNDDLDLDNDGFDGLPTGWSIVDSIAVLGEAGEGYARFYADVVFAPGAIAGPPGGIEPGATYVNTTPTLNEIEYVGRVGPNDGASNWMVTNLTNDSRSGYTNALRNYAVSGDHANESNPEVWVGNVSQPAGFPYGTDITVTLGGPNVNFVVPEPGSFALASIGGAAVLLGLWRRRAV
ncbi:MAG: PEP-CTERM sorting domain-containing protein [Planctomycetaceae bacterium]|nr:PEP-CTERM sorting domain-containing protein [Planctomycetaceae bacterium]